MKNSSTVKPLTDAEGEVRELTAADFKRMRPARDVLHEIFPKALADEMLKPKRGRGPAKKPAKVLTTLRLPPDVLTQWKATGPGWQTRMVQRLSKVG
ncbi:MAG: BrnA antitoxin family protein [Stenotrophobium sp.]